MILVIKQDDYRLLSEMVKALIKNKPDNNIINL